MYSEANSFSREISRHYDSYFEESGLTTSYVELLLILLHSGECSQKEIAERMNLAPSTITRFIGKLKKSGYIEKSRDGKTMSVSLDEKKKEQVIELEQLFNRAEEDLKVVLGQKFIETTGRLLKYGITQLQNEP
jgi:MarR family transcriptional regulator, organic hydroperoxide resistance regulator